MGMAFDNTKKYDPWKEGMISYVRHCEMIEKERSITHKLMDKCNRQEREIKRLKSELSKFRFAELEGVE